jgi:hypothetical protein
VAGRLTLLGGAPPRETHQQPSLRHPVGINDSSRADRHMCRDSMSMLLGWQLGGWLAPPQTEHSPAPLPRKVISICRALTWSSWAAVRAAARLYPIASGLKDAS